MEWSRPTSKATNPALVDVTLRRARVLARKRTKLTAEEEAWQDANLPQAEGMAKERWERLTQTSRMEVGELVVALDLDGAMDELSGVHPYLSDVETPEEIRRNVLALDGMESVAFDVSRRTVRVLAMLEELIPVWEAVWEDVTVAPSVERGAKQAKVMLMDEYEARGRIRGFLAYYRQTMERVRATYEKASRLVSIEGLRHGSSL